MILGAFDINTSGELALWVMALGVVLGAVALATLVIWTLKDW